MRGGRGLLLQGSTEIREDTPNRSRGRKGARLALAGVAAAARAHAQPAAEGGEGVVEAARPHLRGALGEQVVSADGSRIMAEKVAQPGGTFP